MKKLQQYTLASLMFDAQGAAEYCLAKTGRSADECYENFPEGVAWQSPAFHALGAAMELSDYIDQPGINPNEMQTLHEAVTEADIKSLRLCLELEYGHCGYSDALLRTMAMRENAHRAAAEERVSALSK